MAQVNRLTSYKSARFMDGNTLKVIWHSTVIVAAGPDRIVLDTGGYRTKKPATI